MDQDLIIQIVSENVKFIRMENQFTQEKMAETLGISKKTLIQIEKGSRLANWTTAVAVCALYPRSPSLQKQMGRDPLEAIELSIHDVAIRANEKTLGGVFWWKNISVYRGFKLQQNYLSKHYRIIDDENYRIMSTFNAKVAFEKWQGIVKKI